MAWRTDSMLSGLRLFRPSSCRRSTVSAALSVLPCARLTTSSATRATASSWLCWATADALRPCSAEFSSASLGVLSMADRPSVPAWALLRLPLPPTVASSASLAATSCCTLAAVSSWAPVMAALASALLMKAMLALVTLCTPACT